MPRSFARGEMNVLKQISLSVGMRFIGVDETFRARLQAAAVSLWRSSCRGLRFIKSWTPIIGSPGRRRNVTGENARQSGIFLCGLRRNQLDIVGLQQRVSGKDWQLLDLRLSNQQAIKGSAVMSRE